MATLGPMKLAQTIDCPICGYAIKFDATVDWINRDGEIVGLLSADRKPIHAHLWGHRSEQ